MSENKTVFRIIPNGPIHVNGKFEVTGVDGKKIETEGEAWLCRCGGSNEKPFCDGSHEKVGVRD